MKFTKEQISELMCKHAQKENGLHDLLEIMIESMMVAERGLWLMHWCTVPSIGRLLSAFSSLITGWRFIAQENCPMVCRWMTL